MCRAQISNWLFLSSNAQDFIEESRVSAFNVVPGCRFLSSNAQDFIEEGHSSNACKVPTIFLSSNAQDFIEDSCYPSGTGRVHIPEQ